MPPYAQHWPSYGDPRLVHLKCRKCQREQMHIVPQKNAKAFCWMLACECGEAAESSDAIVVLSGHDLLRSI